MNDGPNPPRDPQQTERYFWLGAVAFILVAMLWGLCANSS